MSWGTELWDKYESVLKEVSGVRENDPEDSSDTCMKVSQAGKELDCWYGGFFKERSKLEADYARGLRRLVRNYTVKEKNRREEEETSLAGGFR